jgi:hypothetical protein
MHVLHKRTFSRAFFVRNIRQVQLHCAVPSMLRTELSSAIVLKPLLKVVVVFVIFKLYFCFLGGCLFSGKAAGAGDVRHNRRDCNTHWCNHA